MNSPSTHSWLESGAGIPVILVTLALALRIPFFFDSVLNWDESSFILMGADILKGHLPYVHLWDNKPPFLFAPFAVMLALCGENVVGSRLLGLILVVVGAWLTWRVARLLVSPRAAFWAAVVVILYTTAPPGAGSTMSEHVALPLVAAFLWLLLGNPDSPRSLFVAGIALGLAALSRTNLAAVCPAAAIAVVVLSRVAAVRRMAALAAGCILPVAATGLIYFAAGEWDALYLSMVKAPLSYAAGGLSKWAALREMLEHGARLHSFFLWIAFLAGAAMMTRRSSVLESHRPKVLAAAIITASVFFSIVSSGRFFNHYIIQAIPFMAIAAGVFLSRMWRGNLRVVVALALAIPIAPSLLQSKQIAERIAAHGTPFRDDLYQVAGHLRDEGVRGEYVYFVEGHIGYLLTGAEIPTDLAHPSLVTKENILKAIRGPGATPADEIRSIMEKDPVFIVCRKETWYLRGHPEARRVLDDTLAESYHKAARYGKYEVWKRLPG